MSVKVRMSRAGGKKSPYYRVVVTDSRSPRDGRFIEQVGVYDPTREPPVVRLDGERITHWVKLGAQTSQTVSELLKRAQKAAEPSA